jgi:hypothetical protein
MNKEIMDVDFVFYNRAGTIVFRTSFEDSQHVIADKFIEAARQVDNEFFHRVSVLCVSNRSCNTVSYNELASYSTVQDKFRTNNFCNI